MQSIYIFMIACQWHIRLLVSYYVSRQPILNLTKTAGMLQRFFFSKFVLLSWRSERSLFLLPLIKLLPGAGSLRDKSRSFNAAERTFVVEWWSSASQT